MDRLLAQSGADVAKTWPTLVKSTKSKPIAEEGHTYRFSSPRGGWPRFGPDGKVER